MDWLWNMLDSGTESSAAPAHDAQNSMKGEFDRLREILSQAAAGPPATADDLRRFPDLAQQLKVAVDAAGGDWRRIWYRPAMGFETTIDHVDAVVVGGLHSPAFLWRDPALHPAGRQHWPALPHVWQAAGARILTAESMRGDITEWVPFLEQIVNGKQALLCVTSNVSRELLELLIVNDLRSTLNVAVVHRTAGDGTAVQLKDGEIPPAKLARSLPTASVVARRAATMVTADTSFAGRRADCLWINVGGSDYQDQQYRLKVLACVIAQHAE